MKRSAMAQAAKGLLKSAFVLLLVYTFAAYWALPLYWRHYEHHPQLEAAPKFTVTAEQLAADPINVALVGTEAELIHALIAAGWHPADRITIASSLKIAESVLLARAYDEAPVSNLYLFGRRQDLAFEKLIRSARTRHHVRFWASPELGTIARPLWIGAATYDRSVGVSRTTGQITHHIAPEIDKERDKLMEDLKQAGQLEEIYQVTGIGATLQGRNGSGDWYFTDGELTVGVLADPRVPVSEPSVLPNPPRVEAKNRLIGTLGNFFRRLAPGKE